MISQLRYMLSPVYRVAISAIFALILTITVSIYPSHASDAEWVRGVIHLHTRMADESGKLSMDELLNEVRKKGIGVAVISDHDNERVEYGIFPLRRIIKKVVERKSIKHFGVRDYLDTIRSAEERFPDLTVLVGVEAVPAYYWEGSILNRDLSLRNWHKHILIIGLESPQDIEGIPSVGTGWYKKPDLGCVVEFWPLLLFPLGIYLLRFEKVKEIRFANINFRETKKPYRIPGYISIVSGVVFLINNIPSCYTSHDPYHGDQGIAPYQELIDYVDDKGGLTFWAHPDATFDNTVNGIRVYTPPHPEDLIRSHGYTGFVALLKGKETSIPGGVWDGLLKEYIKGKRERPVWAIGELDYRAGDWMGETETVLLLKQKTKKGVIDALRNGRMYAVTGLPYKPELGYFDVWDVRDKEWKHMGSHVSSGEKARLRVKIGYQGRRSLILRVIKEGGIVARFPIRKELDIIIEDPLKDAETTYYRIDVGYRIERGGGRFEPLLISNPIFVKRVEG